jgi:hypothetical protein
MTLCIEQAAAAAIAREIPELVTKLDSLLDELSAINLPASPLDALIDKLGKQLYYQSFEQSSLQLTLYECCMITLFASRPIA